MQIDIEKVVDMKMDKVSDMKVDKATNMEVDKVADMEVDKMALQCCSVVRKCFSLILGPFVVKSK